jgi:geranylgeranyl diphosphate synthase type II
VVAGGVYAGATAEDAARLDLFGRKAGLAFQIADDVLDMTQDSAAWARPPARTWPPRRPPGRPSSASSRAERDAAADRRGLCRLEPLASRADGLKAVARYLVERKS